MTRHMLISLLWITTLQCFSAHAEELREWESANGKKIMAQFVDTTPAGVKLQIKGATTSIVTSYKNLSIMDRRYAISRSRTQPLAMDYRHLSTAKYRELKDLKIEADQRIEWNIFGSMALQKFNGNQGLDVVFHDEDSSKDTYDYALHSALNSERQKYPVMYSAPFIDYSNADPRELKRANIQYPEHVIKFKDAELIDLLGNHQSIVGVCLERLIGLDTDSADVKCLSKCSNIEAMYIAQCTTKELHAFLRLLDDKVNIKYLQIGLLEIIPGNLASALFDHKSLVSLKIGRIFLQTRTDFLSDRFFAQYLLLPNLCHIGIPSIDNNTPQKLADLLAIVTGPTSKIRAISLPPTGTQTLGKHTEQILYPLFRHADMRYVDLVQVAGIRGFDWKEMLRGSTVNLIGVDNDGLKEGDYQSFTQDMDTHRSVYLEKTVGVVTTTTPVQLYPGTKTTFTLLHHADSR